VAEAKTASALSILIMAARNQSAEWRYVRFWHLADNSAVPEFVRYWSNSGH
jgi:hypothetical protein